jgi:hypothetical protein
LPQKCRGAFPHREAEAQADLDWHWRYNACGLLLVAIFAAGMAFVAPLLALLA